MSKYTISTSMVQHLLTLTTHKKQLKPMGIYMGSLVLGAMLQYVISASFSIDHDHDDTIGWERVKDMQDWTELHT